MIYIEILNLTRELYVEHVPIHIDIRLHAVTLFCVSTYGKLFFYRDSSLD